MAELFSVDKPAIRTLPSPSGCRSVIGWFSFCFDAMKSFVTLLGSETRLTAPHVRCSSLSHFEMIAICAV